MMIAKPFGSDRLDDGRLVIRCEVNENDGGHSVDIVLEDIIEFLKNRIEIIFRARNNIPKTYDIEIFGTFTITRKKARKQFKKLEKKLKKIGFNLKLVT